jgi:hypothetical protein
MEREAELESVFEYFQAQAEQFALMRDVAALTSDAGDRMFADPMSAWSRKLQVFVLGFSSVTLLLASGLVSTVEVTNGAVKATGLTPEFAALSAALVTLGGLVFYSISCYQDWALHSIRSDASVKRTAERSLAYSLEALDATQKADAKHAAAVKADLAQTRKDGEDLAKLSLLEAERSQGAFPSWKAVQLAEINARLQESLPSQSLAAEAETRVLRRRAQALDAASSSLSELLTRYRSHLRLRVLAEVLAPILYGCFSVWIARH